MNLEVLEIIGLGHVQSPWVAKIYFALIFILLIRLVLPINMSSSYYLSLFLIPAHVSTSLEKIMRNFFWEGFAGGKINHLVKWSLVSLPFKDGGLGVGGIKTQNSALLAKWGWRYSKEDSAL